MKTKTIPFDLETAKKIQAGEIEGKIKTRDGRKARILCNNVQNDEYPIVVAAMDSVRESVYQCRIDGSYYVRSASSNSDLVLEVPDNEPQFKPFDKVLVRDRYGDKWRCSLFSHEDKNGYCASGFYWRQCIPYKGNEHLLCTNDEPKEE